MNSRDDILSSVQILFRPGNVVEVRAIGDNSMASGYFDDPEKLADKVEILNSNPDIQGIYVTLNEVNPILLSRRANRIKTRMGKKDASTADTDIIRRNWLPIDIDPIRPSGLSSSEEEHSNALARADSIVGYLFEMGWSEPIIGDSGNGAHLLYRIDLPNDDFSRDLVKSCLEFLSVRFSDDRCKVDTANFNASRIWKLYGTISRKGDNTADRPHRQSRIISAPKEPDVISLEDLKRLSLLFPKEAPPQPRAQNRKNDGKAIDLAEWFTRNGIGYESKPYSDGTLFILDECPFSSAHKDGAYAIQFSSGAIFASCHHDSCGHGTQRWAELRDRFEGPRPDQGERIKKMKRDRQKQKAIARGDIPAGRDDEERQSSLRSRAGEILQSGDPLRVMLSEFAKDHEGDQVVAQCMIMSFASRSVINSKGLHVSITGESGKGKSHAVDMMLEQVPEEFRISGRMSDKALFYMPTLRPGTVISLDDVNLSDSMQEILKGVTTSFQKEFVYHTVSKDRLGMDCIIPERCVWWVSKVEGMGDDQVFNRMLTCWIDDTLEQDQRVLDRSLEDAERMPIAQPKTRDEILIIREMWRSLRPVYVVIPFARRIRFQSSENRRNPDMLLDLIRTSASLRQHQRQREEVDEMVCIMATEEDFCDASRLYEALNGETGGQVTKLTKKEALLIDAIRSMRMDEVTIAQMQKTTGWSSSVISKLLNGYVTRGQVYSGLLEKCPAISYLDRTITTNDDHYSVSTQRRVKVFTWDESLYARWATGGSVWLAPDDADRDDHDHGGSDDCRKISADNAQFPLLSAAAENEPNPEGGLVRDLRKNILDPISFSAESQITAPPQSPAVCSGKPVCDPGVTENTIGKRPPQPPVPCSGLQNERVRSSNDPKATNPAENKGIRSSNNIDRIPLTDIDTKDFLSIDGFPDKRPCSVCGRKCSHYQEKMSRERMAGRPRPNRTLCKTCFVKAQSIIAARFMALPGMVRTQQMTRVSSATFGRCNICDTGPITWLDHEDHFGICEVCYQRESAARTGKGVSDASS